MKKIMNTGEYAQKQSEKVEISLAKVPERKRKAAFWRLFSFSFHISRQVGGCTV
ncbi:MAG: hypothetical protein KH332_09380 [Firmicutes bacterium]|nr:hypothetical protein [Bacillota bacterium]